MMGRSRLPTPRTALSLLVLLACGVAIAQEQQFREREVFDPSAGGWVTAPESGDVEPAGPLDEARALLRESKPRGARKLLEDWVEANPDHPRYYEGVFLLGECEFERDDFRAANRFYDEVAENAVGDLLFDALLRQMDVARAYLSGEKQIVWKVLKFPAYDEGISILDRVWERAPGTRIGEFALKLKADYFYGVGDFDLAQDEYVLLANEYPNGRYLRYAMLRAAESANNAFAGIAFDERPLLNADERFRQIEQEFPVYADREAVPERREGIRNQLAEKDLAVGDWYNRTGSVEAAAYYYRSVIEQYADTIAASEAQLRLRELGLDSEVNSPADMDDMTVKTGTPVSMAGDSQ